MQNLSRLIFRKWERLISLNEIAKNQIRILNNNKNIKHLEVLEDKVNNEKLIIK